MKMIQLFLVVIFGFSLTSLAQTMESKIRSQEDVLNLFKKLTIKRKKYNKKASYELLKIINDEKCPLEGIINLIEQGADINSRNNDEDTPLHIISIQVDPSISTLTMLLKYGADINAMNKYKDTPLHLIAMQPTSASVINVLLTSGANPNSRNKYGETPLHSLINPPSKPFELIIPELIAAIKLLLENKADPNITESCTGRSPLYCICMYENPVLDGIKLLLKGGADSRTKNIYGTTILHLMCFRKNPSIEAMKLVIFFPLMAGNGSFEKTLEILYKNNASFKKNIFTYMLCLKRYAFKVPKFVNFEIIKFIILDDTHRFITQKNKKRKTALMIAEEKEHIKAIAFLKGIENACEQGYENFIDFMKTFE